MDNEDIKCCVLEFHYCMYDSTKKKEQYGWIASFKLSNHLINSENYIIGEIRTGCCMKNISEASNLIINEIKKLNIPMDRYFHTSIESEYEIPDKESDEYYVEVERLTKLGFIK